MAHRREQKARPKKSPPGPPKKRAPKPPPRSPTPSPPPATHERRQHKRVELLAQVQVSRDNEVHIMSTRDISRGGAFILGNPADTPELEPDVEFELVIFAADMREDDGAAEDGANDDSPGDEGAEEDIFVTARVVRTYAGSSRQSGGFGVRFVRFAPGSFERLSSLLAGRDPHA